MDEILKLIKEIVMLYLAMAIVSQVLLETELNRFLRFFVGIVTVLLVCATGFFKETGENLERKIEIGSLLHSFQNESINEDTNLHAWGKNVDYAIEILISGFNQTLLEEEVEIKQFECKKNVDGSIRYVVLYLEKLDQKDCRGRFSKEVPYAERCKKKILEEWKVEFELIVYGRA